MNIAGLQKISMIDYPGKIAVVLFTQGCNLHCGYCHNPQLIECVIQTSRIPENAVFEHLRKRQNIIEGIVISGGEPTLQPDLAQFIAKFRGLNLKIKLDTNGTHPETLEYLMANELVDFVALDVKAPPAFYSQICGKRIDPAKIAECIRLLQKSAIAYEFRTTLAPELGIRDLQEIQQWIGETSHWILQKCRPVNDKFNEVTISRSTVSDTKTLSAVFPDCRLRGFND